MKNMSFSERSHLKHLVEFDHLRKASLIQFQKSKKSQTLILLCLHNAAIV